MHSAVGNLTSGVAVDFAVFLNPLAVAEGVDTACGRVSSRSTARASTSTRPRGDRFCSARATTSARGHEEDE